MSVESRHRARAGKSGRSVVVKPVAAYESDAKKAHAVGELGATVPWPLTIGSHSWSLRSISSSPPTAIDHTSFCALFLSPYRRALSPRFPSVAPRSQGLGFACGGPDGLGASLHDRP